MHLQAAKNGRISGAHDTQALFRNSHSCCIAFFDCDNFQLCHNFSHSLNLYHSFLLMFEDDF